MNPTIIVWLIAAGFCFVWSVYAESPICAYAVLLFVYALLDVHDDVLKGRL